MQGNLFEGVETALYSGDPAHKCRLVRDLFSAWQEGNLSLADPGRAPLPPGPPGRPARPLLVPPQEVGMRRVGNAEGRAAMLHAIAHIEFNAINLALDAVYRFRDLPAGFHGGWLRVALEEVEHFELVCGHLEAVYSHRYGDFPAHDGLWDMALRTAHDPLVRMALIPRLFEARGLDATPGIMHKFRSVGEQAAVAILEVILAEEVGHVALGDFWFRHLCRVRGLEPETCFLGLLAEYGIAPPRRPLNEEARRAAGFSEAELARFSV